jgi:hypothetical protein
VPVGSHCHLIGFAVFSQGASVLDDKLIKILPEDCVGIHHLFMLVELLDRRQDEAEEDVNKRSIHVDDVIQVLSRIVCVIFAAVHLLPLVQAVNLGTSSALVGNDILHVDKLHQQSNGSTGRGPPQHKVGSSS